MYIAVLCLWNSSQFPINQGFNQIRSDASNCQGRTRLVRASSLDRMVGLGVKKETPIKTYKKGTAIGCVTQSWIKFEAVIVFP